MQKKVSEQSPNQKRVLARSLAEELRGVRGTGDPVEVTGVQADGRRDITNVSADNAV